MRIKNNSDNILVTLGPSSLKRDVITEIDREDIYLFRINLSHTPLDVVPSVIDEIREYTQTPICIDSEGAQIRNQRMDQNETFFELNTIVKIHFEEVLGDEANISFTPVNIAEQFVVGDEIKIDFNSVCLKVIEKNKDHCLAKVINGGKVSSNKAVDVNRAIALEPITEKDRKAIRIMRSKGITHFALSFAGSESDVNMMRDLVDRESIIISKIESIPGLHNLKGILNASDEILIDRGDLSRQVSLEKIPFLQRRIISTARSMEVPVYVATNCLESMIKIQEPTRAEINDVVSTISMGANGLVLAAETAIGKFPIEAVRMIRKLIRQQQKWTPNTSISELLEN